MGRGSRVGVGMQWGITGAGRCDFRRIGKMVRDTGFESEKQRAGFYSAGNRKRL